MLPKANAAYLLDLGQIKRAASIINGKCCLLTGVSSSALCSALCCEIKQPIAYS